MKGSGDAAKAGIGFGTALAIAISWSANGSILVDTTPRSGDVLLAQHTVVNTETREEAAVWISRA